LVRGATLHGLQTEDLRNILKASRELTVHHSAMAALPGAFGVQALGLNPISLAVPDLLVGKVDVQKPSGPNPKPPIMTRPAP
jgi:hypothetical protein